LESTAHERACYATELRWYFHQAFGEGGLGQQEGRSDSSVVVSSHTDRQDKRNAVGWIEHRWQDSKSSGRGHRRRVSAASGGELPGMAGRVSLLPALLVAFAVLVAGCGSIRIPADPDGTLDRVRSGVLRVGVSPHEPWTRVTTAEPDGRESDLVRRWAAGLDARIAWTVGGEQPLVQAMERGELDLVIGGITSDTPWVDQAAVTRPYATSEGPDGPQEHVMLAPMGENAFLVELERYLLAQEVPA
jgi:hypothetical protein